MRHPDTSKPPLRIVAVLVAILTILAVMGMALLYMVAIYGLSPGQMIIAGWLFLLLGTPLLGALFVIARPYSKH